MTLRVAVIPDVHMRNEYRDELHERLAETATRIRSFDPGIVVVLGDIIEEESPARDREHVELVRETLSFDCSVRYLAGNHDPQHLSHEELVEAFGNELWGIRRIGDEKLVFLDTSAPWLSGSRGEVTDEQLELLREVSAQPEPFTVFVHHPIHYYDISNTYWWSTYPERAFCGNKKEINAALDPAKVKAVVNGHTHENNLERYAGIDHVTLNAFGKETPEIPVTGTHAELAIGNTVRVNVKVGDALVRGYELGVSD